MRELWCVLSLIRRDTYRSYCVCGRVRACLYAWQAKTLITGLRKKLGRAEEEVSHQCLRMGVRYCSTVGKIQLRVHKVVCIFCHRHVLMSVRCLHLLSAQLRARSAAHREEVASLQTQLDETRSQCAGLNWNLESKDGQVGV